MAVDFKTTQLEFTRYIREPDTYPVPDQVKPERIQLYRELIFNNIEGFLASNFPVIHTILEKDQWYKLVQDFFSGHSCKTPYFSGIAEEFLDYLENERDEPKDFPFLLELAHYEWVEVALAIAKDPVITNFQVINNLLDHSVTLSTLALPLLYQYPVQLISPEFLPLEPPAQPTCLIAYRNQDDEVKFMEINALTYRMLELIQEQEKIPVQTCLSQLAQESQHPNPDLIISGGLQTLNELVEKTVVLISNPST